MPKQKRLVRCAFCGETATTRDHIPPKSIYPAPRPTDLITVPACVRCNEGSKLDDEYFRWLIATAATPSESAFAIIEKRIIPNFTKRPALLHDVMSKSTCVDLFSQGGIYLDKSHAFNFDRHRIQNVIEKIVRGLYYHTQQSTLPKAASVSPFILNPAIPPDYSNSLASLILHDTGNGIFSYRYHSDTNAPQDTFWFLMFYDQVLFVAKTYSKKSFLKY